MRRLHDGTILTLALVAMLVVHDSRRYYLSFMCDSIITLLSNGNYQISSVRIEPLKARHDVIKLDLIVPLLSFWCIEIDLSI